MSRTVQVVFDCASPPAMTAFWAQALGYVEQPPPEGFDSWPAALEAWGVPASEHDRAGAVVDPDGDGPRVFFQRVPEGKQAKNRVHLDLRVSTPADAPDVREAAVVAEAARLEGLGATRVELRADLGVRFMVMLDVEGNEFCLT